MSRRSRTFLAALAGVAGVAVATVSCGSDGAGPSAVGAPDLPRAEPSANAPEAELIDGLNGAGFELLSNQPVDENLVLSPLSIGHTLLMARAAADEPTGDAIDTGFGLPSGLAAHEAWTRHFSSISNSPDRGAPATASSEPRSPTSATTSRCCW